MPDLFCGMFGRRHLRKLHPDCRLMQKVDRPLRQLTCGEVPAHHEGMFTPGVGLHGGV
jgi:hypothetical protein